MLLQSSLLLAQLFFCLDSSPTRGMTNTGLNLFLQLQKEDQENTVMSPFSLTSGLHVLLLGAAGGTREQLEKMLESDSEAHLQLQKINHGLKSISDESTVHIANKVFFHHETELSENFVNLSTNYLDTVFKSVNFKDDSLDNLLLEINSEVKEETNGKIAEILSADLMTEDMRMVLVNILYFKGRWKKSFPLHKTIERAFYVEQDRHVMIETMQIETHIKYLETEEFQSGVLEFRQSDVEMILIKPKKSLNSLLQHTLTYEVLERSYKNMQYELVELNLPKFVVKSKYSLKKQLSTMGMTDMFLDSKADFSRMTSTGSKDLVLSEVLHNTFISVDEEGCEAASVTGAVMRLTRSALIGPEPVLFHLDRPFLYLLRDKRSGVVLFAGKQGHFPGKLVVKKTEL